MCLNIQNMKCHKSTIRHKYYNLLESYEEHFANITAEKLKN